MQDDEPSRIELHQLLDSLIEAPISHLQADSKKTTLLFWPFTKKHWRSFLAAANDPFSTFKDYETTELPQSPKKYVDSVPKWKIALGCADTSLTFEDHLAQAAKTFSHSAEEDSYSEDEDDPDDSDDVWGKEEDWFVDLE